MRSLIIALFSLGTLLGVTTAASAGPAQGGLAANPASASEALAQKTTWGYRRHRHRGWHRGWHGPRVYGYYRPYRWHRRHWNYGRGYHWGHRKWHRRGWHGW